MKKILIFIFMAQMLFSNAIKFEKSYDAAISKAQKENKILMAVIIQNFCPWCTKFKNRTLRDVKVIRLVNEKFVPLMLNKDNNQIPNNIRTRMVPTTFFLNSEGKKISSAIGFKEPGEFIDDLHDAIKLNKR